MWIATRIGFFSIVKKDEGWHIRARVKADLERLRDFVLEEAGIDIGSIQTWPDADYRWRCITSEELVLLEMVEALALDIDYPNFKNEVASQPDQRDKLDAYSELWGALFTLQQWGESKSMQKRKKGVLH